MTRLASEDWQSAWSDFIQEYASRILNVIRLFAEEEETRDDCFVFVCEQLRADRCRRLRQFDATGPASLDTWLRAVVRNLCIDWRRKQLGRYRPFRSLADLSDVEREVFRCAFERGMTLTEIRSALSCRFGPTSESEVERAVDRITRRLSSRQLWLLASHRARRDAVGAEESLQAEAEPRTDDPDPETLAQQHELLGRLGEALHRLPGRDLLILRLRYEEGLTLEQVGSLTGLGGAQRADRTIHEILLRIREDLNHPPPGKPVAASVNYSERRDEQRPD